MIEFLVHYEDYSKGYRALPMHAMLINPKFVVAVHAAPSDLAANKPRVDQFSVIRLANGTAAVVAGNVGSTLSRLGLTAT